MHFLRCQLNHFWKSEEQSLTWPRHSHHHIDSNANKTLFLAHVSSRCFLDLTLTMHLPSYGQPLQTNKVAVDHRFPLPVRPRASRRVPPSGQLTQTTMVCPLLSRRAAGRRNRKCLASVASVSRACSAPPPSWRPMASQIDQHFVDRCLARSAA